MAGQGQGTEKPTQRRLEKARKEGRFPSSRHFAAGLHFAAFVAVISCFGPAFLSVLQSIARHFLRAAFLDEIDAARVVTFARHDLAPAMAPLAAAGGGLAMLSLGAHMMSTRLGLAWNRLAPDFTRLNPGSRLRELPGRNIGQLLYAVVVLVLFGFALRGLVTDNLPFILQLPLLAAPAGLAQAAGILKDLLWKAAGVFLLIGVADLLRERRRHWKGLMMSRQEIQEEMKEVEGNPLTKLRIRRLQRDLLRRRMMSEVPKATAVIVNPTHYAVAIKYDVQAMAAPRVVAKGKNYLALRIRQKAVDHLVPIIENPPLAQTLYKSVAVGQEIPVHLYRAVAEVLAYIFRLMKVRK